MFSGLKRVIFWDFPRASWQYDIIVAAILAFIFLTPRDWFRDQPRIPQFHEVALLPSPKGANVLWIEPGLMAKVPEDATPSVRLAKISELLKANVTKVDPVYNSEQEVIGYTAVTKP